MQEISPVGVVFFDNPNDPRSGIASLNGGDVFRIFSVGDLDSEACWITNLSFHNMLDARLGNNPKIKTSSFLRMDLTRLSVEIDVDPVSSPTQAVKALSALASRLVSYAAKGYGFTQIGRTLKDSLQASIILEAEPVLYQSQVITDAIKDAFHPAQLCFGVPPRNGVKVPLRYSRAWYCRKLMAQPIPQGSWRATNVKFPIVNVADFKFGKNSKCYLFLLEVVTKFPCLVKVNVKDVEEEVASLIDHGNGRDVRDWLPGHEALNIAFYADVEIKDILVAEQYTSLEQNEIYRFPFDHVTDDISFSAGVIAENHWVSLASSVKTKRFGQFVTVYPPRAAFIRAWDRLFCFKAAKFISKKGYFVQSYSVGTVHVVCEPHEVSDLIKHGASIGLTCSMSHIETSSFDRYFHTRADI